MACLGPGVGALAGSGSVTSGCAGGTGVLGATVSAEGSSAPETVDSVDGRAVGDAGVLSGASAGAGTVSGTGGGETLSGGAGVDAGVAGVLTACSVGTGSVGTGSAGTGSAGATSVGAASVGATSVGAASLGVPSAWGASVMKLVTGSGGRDPSWSYGRKAGSPDPSDTGMSLSLRLIRIRLDFRLATTRGLSWLARVPGSRVEILFHVKRRAETTGVGPGVRSTWNIIRRQPAPPSALHSGLRVPSDAEPGSEQPTGTGS